MADVKWIKITTDIFDDEKILLIESLPDAYAIITVWFKLLCLAGKQNNSGVFMMGKIAYTDRMLATIFRMKESTVSMALQTFEQFEMIEIIDGVITIPNWGKHQSLEQLEARREYQREYHREYRQKQKLLAAKEDDKHLRKCLRKQDVNTLEEDIEKEIDIDIEINTNSASDNAPKVSKFDINLFFESIWKLYPNKKGKGQVSDSKKKALYEIGIEEMTRAIERYVSDLEKEDWRKPQNGSTFFNSGYVDYLDANYQPVKAKPQKKNGFNNFNQRQYNYEELERDLFNHHPQKNEVEDP